MSVWVGRMGMGGEGLRSAATFVWVGWVGVVGVGSRSAMRCDGLELVGRSS